MGFFKLKFSLCRLSLLIAFIHRSRTIERLQCSTFRVKIGGGMQMQSHPGETTCWICGALPDRVSKPLDARSRYPRSRSEGSVRVPGERQVSFLVGFLIPPPHVFNELAPLHIR
ncbi:hypothetical protein OF83DRAFT_471820 [Amylostereum chailletii]|nr:hypothetical protein OF83DRAFT_471820 [Amylostereum chailletii]